MHARVKLAHEEVMVVIAASRRHRRAKTRRSMLTRRIR
jgi:hypothetical protein